MYKILTIWILVMAIPASAGFVEDKIGSNLPKNAKWSLEIVDLESGKNIISTGRGGEFPFTSVSESYDSSHEGRGVNGTYTPASLVKLVTTGAVLSSEGRRNRKINMDTDITYSGYKFFGKIKGDLFIKGRGNSALNEMDFKKAVGHMKEKGIKKITGNIVADSSAFNASGIKRIRKGTAYAVPTALSMNMNTVTVVVVPGEVGKPPVVTTNPVNNNVRFAVSARVAEGVLDTLKIIKLDDSSYKVTGNVPPSTGTRTKRFELDNPAIFVAGVMKTLLVNAGIKVEGSLKEGITPEGAKMIHTIKAPAIEDTLKFMNRASMNVIADSLFLLLGGSSDKSQVEMKKFLREIGMSKQAVDNVAIKDGSGLNGENKVTPEFMAEFLFKMSKTKEFKKFKDTLPTSGEGTMKNFAYKNNMFKVKTGSLENNFNLAGYGVDKRGRDIAFSYMVEAPGLGMFGVDKIGSDVMKMIAEDTFIEGIR